MDYAGFYADNATDIRELDDRLHLVLDLIAKRRPTRLLDIGCGAGTLLSEIRDRHPGIDLVGLDVRPNEAAPWRQIVGDVTRRIDLDDGTFDLVVLGEIIEHVPDPDFLLAEVRRLLAPGGEVIVTTPNLVSWANRLLVATGTQPLFTETSTAMNLGRRHRLLGQGRKVQGHLKVFTHRSLAEIMELSGFDVTERRGTAFFFPQPIDALDRALSRFPSMASGLVYVGRRRERLDLQAVDLRNHEPERTGSIAG